MTKRKVEVEPSGTVMVKSWDAVVLPGIEATKVLTPSVR
jgi:hypothetical protein